MEIFDILDLDENEWSKQQPKFLAAAKEGVFTKHLSVTKNVRAEFYKAIGITDENKPFSYSSFVSSKWYKSGIVDSFDFTVIGVDGVLVLKQVGCSRQGLFKVFWTILIQIVERSDIETIIVNDRCANDDVWSRYGFSGKHNDRWRTLSI